MSTATLRDDATDRVERLPAWALPLAVLAVAVVAEISRRPDIFRAPQLFAEDGQFFANAHNAGALAGWFTQSNGYLQLAARIVAAIATAAPLAWAPAVVLVGAVLCNALPAAFVVSDRMRSAIPSVWARVLLAALYVALPGANHASGVLTYSQWHLSLVAFMVLVAEPPKTRVGLVGDYTVVAISCLSGPYSILLAPVAVINWYLRPSVRTGTLAAVVLVEGVAQAAILLTIGFVNRSTAPRGASAGLFFKILGARVFYAATLGHEMQAMTLPSWPRTFGNDRAFQAAGVTTIVLGALAFWRGSHALRMMLLFGAAIVAAILVNASVDPAGPPQWVVLTNQDALATYFVIPITAFYAACVWMATRSAWAWRAAGVALIAVAVLFGVRHDWREQPVEDLDWAASVEAYRQTPAGAAARIPIPPQPWTIELVKPAGGT